MINYLSNYNNIFLAFIACLFTWLITILGAMVVFLFKKVNKTLLDAMLGFASKESNKITNTSSATLVKAMRQACKNILYTTVNSGNYTIPDPDAGKMSNMTKLFLEIDITSGIVLVAVMATVLVRFFKKRKKNVAEEA